MANESKVGMRIKTYREKMKMTLAELGVEVSQTNGWKLASVTGLPTGLSWNGSAIVGAASKTGVFAVTFTMKKTVKDPKTKKTKTYTSTATANVATRRSTPSTRRSLTAGRRR